MIRLEQLKLPLNYTQDLLERIAAERLGVAPGAIREARVLRRSVDARRKPALAYVASVAVRTDWEEKLIGSGRAVVYTPPPCSLEALGLPRGQGRVAVIGTGPAGLFCALTLAKYGVSPVLIERGSDVDRRKAVVARCRETGEFSPKTNVQFGEGGAGTFSDGKLTTGTSSPFASAVIGELIAHGAPEEIAYLAHPHVGTDYLGVVVKRIREEIVKLGGQVLFETCATDFRVESGRLRAIVTEGNREGILEADAFVLAPGHSARDTLERLRARGIPMIAKPFSVGVRIEHLQTSINRTQYGTETPPFAAEYKFAAHLSDGRGVYTFCVCPGGEVVMAGSESGGIATNGMSEFARAGRNANSAVLVNVDERDYGEGILAGVAYQRGIERAAFAVSRAYRAPVQRLDDFVKGRVTDRFGQVMPTVRPQPVCADLNGILPAPVSAALKEGLSAFGRKAEAFQTPDAVLTGVETRSSSPVRILRGEDLQSPIAGLYPCGEGAGYAGGIMSAATDGVRVAATILRKGGKST